MELTKRVHQLRTQSLQAVEHITAERAILITEFYQSPASRNLSPPVKRARAFEYLLRHKHICINEGELIVGERGPAPKATPTYPEINLHSLQDLEVLDSREKVSFKVEGSVKQAYQQQIIPFWQGRDNRSRIMAAMPPEWHAAYRAGIFTEFQEQRAPGHTVLGQKLFHTGFLQLKEEIRQSMEQLKEHSDPNAPSKLEELKAMDICCDAIIHYAVRHAETLEQLAKKEKSITRKRELQAMSAICRRVPAHAPRTFHEMLQHYWFIHLGVITELNPWDSFNPGRLDQHLFPLYQHQIDEGSLTEEKAFELLCCFWVKFNNHPAPPKIGVTAQESSTYTDFCLINLGGVKDDGSDGVNAVSYLLLDVIREMRLLQPSSMVQISRENPDRFIHKALDIIRTGFGQPSCFNTDAIVQELVSQGKDITDARRGGASGCVEAGAFGTEAYWLTGYFNLPKILELTLYDGKDPRTGEQVGLPAEPAAAFSTFDALMEAFTRQLRYFADIKIRGNNLIEQIFAQQLPAPFLSLLIEDCIRNGKDYNAGGARYNTSYIQGVGMGSITDMLAAISFHIYEKGTFTWAELLAALDANFEGFESLQYELLYCSPKYGNDDEKADRHAIRVFDLFHDAVAGNPNSRGGVHRINLLPTTSHVYFGSVTGATPDGRGAGKPLSEGISPVQGADRQGPTAVVLSAAKLGHLRTGGTLLNQKFSPLFFEEEGSYEKLTALIRAYFSLNGHHIQFNVVDADTLRDAQKHPELHQGLIVRVAGYSDYFNDIGTALQEEIIQRTEQGGMG
ncbi:MAG: glycyl radical protein [Phaeodactylibacter sp.]|nr:glycyl radical protein [Phaeodactylibacter sp.]MCB9049651.1 glycyl radical protein [Lewinellaceae bacterium]